MQSHSPKLLYWRMTWLIETSAFLLRSFCALCDARATPSFEVGASIPDRAPS